MANWEHQDLGLHEGQVREGLDDFGRLCTQLVRGSALFHGGDLHIGKDVLQWLKVRFLAVHQL